MTRREQKARKRKKIAGSLGNSAEVVSAVKKMAEPQIVAPQKVPAVNPEVISAVEGFSQADARQTTNAIRGGWNAGELFPLEKTLEDFIAVQQAGGTVCGADRMVMNCRIGLRSKDTVIQEIAGRQWMRMAEFNAKIRATQLRYEEQFFRPERQPEPVQNIAVAPAKVIEAAAVRRLSIQEIGQALIKNGDAIRITAGIGVGRTYSGDASGEPLPVRDERE